MKIKLQTISATLFLLLIIIPTAVSADIVWKVYTQSSMQSGPVVSKNMSVGQEFVIDEADFQQVPSDSRDLLYSLVETSFLLAQSPVSGSLEIRLIFNMSGNSFSKLSGKSLFLNMTVETWRNGNRDDAVSFSRSPLIMTIPRSNLSDLLSSSGLSKDGIICAYYEGGLFSADGISTSNMTSRLESKIEKTGQFVGGDSTELGVASKVKVDSWFKIKQLFR